MDEIKLLIGNEDPAAKSGATYDRIDPVTDAVATRAPASTSEDARLAEAAAAADRASEVAAQGRRHHGFQGW